MAKIFISYRREDAGFAVDQVHAAMKPYAKDPGDIFIDIDTIPPGQDFVDHLNAYVQKCDVMLVAIGQRWLEARDPETGARRLDNPNDFVRIEIESALARGIPVVPLLIGGAEMPGEADLPESLRPLVRRQAVAVPRGGVQQAIDRMMQGLGFAEVAKSGGRLPGWLVPLAAIVLLAVGGIGVWQSGVLDRFIAPSDSPVEALEATEVVEEEATTPALSTTPSPRYTVGSTFRDTLSGGGQGPEMVVVPGGTFRMGSNDGDSNEKPVHSVTIPRNFAVGKFEVTWAEWEACVADGGCDNAGPASKGGDEGWGEGNRPVINVDWNDAKAYVRWLSRKTGESYRLLSEAEWEYVARAGTTTAYWWGNQASHDYANYGKDQCCGGLATGRDRWENTAPVGSFSANAFGLHDLHGNVWEWTEDCWNGSYSGAPSNGSAWLSGNCDRRVLRGGSWGDVPQSLRSANRYWSDSSLRGNVFGFRIARDLSD